MIDIDKRTFELGVRIIKLVNILPRIGAGIAIGNQVIRSGTSMGANVQEALGGHTKSEFIYSMNIAKKEGRETRYWLQLIIASDMLPVEKVAPLLKECDELVAILTVIVKNSRKTEKVANL